MGVKSNYFRHSFNAHSDTKIRKLIQRKGAMGYAVYFVLLENYCRKLFDDDQRKIVQELDMKLIASHLGVRSDSVHSCLIVMAELELICHLSPKYDLTMVNLSIPKSLKYFGKYQVVSEEICPKENKRKEIKEKESKVKEIKVNEVFVEFENSPLTQVLTQVQVDLQKKWIEVYGKDFCLEEFKKIYTWLAANPAKSPKSDFGKFINTWLTRGWESHRKTLPTNFSKAQAIQDRLVNYKNPFSKENT